MRAAYMPAPGRIEVADFEIPRPGDGQVLVRMEYASICGSDTHVVHHGFHLEHGLGQPGYPGHEGVGEVVESRSPSYVPGQAVLTAPISMIGGCFSEYMVIDARQLVALPDGDRRRLLLGQQLGTTIFAMKKFWPGGPVHGQGKVAAVIGAGSAGLFFLQHLRRLGFDRVIVSDLDSRRLEVAGRLGADETVQAPARAIGEVIADLTAGRGADFIIEAAGYDATRAEAVEALANQGTAGFYGFPELHGHAPFPTYPAFRKSATVQWASRAQDEPGLASFREAVAAIAAGEVEVDYCTEVTFDLEQVPEAIELAAQQGRGAVKIGIRIAADAS
ncbi:zinc-binding dehydrogenase [Sphaerimonospora thailandensis]|uniref:Threonine dehydrogenase-like Zn-dependent dehydrogenase n=1 Tax=Sphaerimonospora thailandensis TaxID=795644 RepID=A0A8J3R5A0_9ACTN|nr:zinc-binding dehydrogenase [Sphaerimonospora thailandensis]GIH68091.1 hypothetical protein Mth01_03440 [Sphaerimonospora thailandensis]